MGPFGWLDYLLFAVTLCASALIGIYFGCFGNGQKSVNQYLYADKELTAIPVGLSLYSSAVSAIAIIGTPSEVYVFGTQLVVGSLGSFLALFITWNITLPVFCSTLALSSPYEYFERRFSKNVRILTSIIYIVYTLLYMPIILYASTISLSKVTEIPLLVCTSVVGGICIFYTMLGGIKSVIWTDTLQATLMLIACLIVTIMGVQQAGGFDQVWKKAIEGNRINFFNMDPNPLTRTSFWSTLIGMTFLLCAHSGSSATALQRYMCSKNQTHARISTVIGAAGYVLIFFITAMMGLAMYALYSDCDPIKSKVVKDANELVPHFIMETSGKIPGLVGFFLAGLLSAALSTLSSELNVTAALIYFDVFLKMFKKKFNKSHDIFILRIIVVVIGVMSLSAIPLLEKSKYIFQLVLSMGGFAYGARLGILLLGTAFPMANSKGAICGSITSIIVVAWISFGALYNNVSSEYVLTTSVENCIMNASTFSTTVPIMTEKQSDILMVYHLSFCYYTLLGTLLVIIVGVAVSYLTGPTKWNDVEPLLFAPFLRPSIST